MPDGIFDDQGEPELPINEEMDAAEGGWQDIVADELANQTAKLEDIKTNTANFQLQPAVIG